MKYIDKLVEKELRWLDSKIKRNKQSVRVAIKNNRFKVQKAYEKIGDRLSYRRLCLHRELELLNEIQRGK